MNHSGRSIKQVNSGGKRLWRRAGDYGVQMGRPDPACHSVS
jgi:hypothetical protein